ncbi:MAG: DUF4350 domain-containing protein [Candidatus Omnitrophica bacterium]|nr:DUF4350 domain-containing protein [Candidatus Omnitrophota bacterium]
MAYLILWLLLLGQVAWSAASNGLGEAVETMMGVEPGHHASIIPRPVTPHTSFFYAGPYDPKLAVPTDAVRLYFLSTSSDLAMYSSWAKKGFEPQTMVHSRFGWEVRPLLDEVQMDRQGKLSAVGDSKDYYKVPTLERTELAKRYYVGPLEAGATGVGFDEPEYWAHTGYSTAFKKEWQAVFGTPWQPPHSSVDARYRSEQLKGILFRRHVEAILKDAAQRKPAAVRLVAFHSPVNYYQWNIVAPHNELVRLPWLQEIIAEVWTGTAQTPCLAEGERKARIFEVAFLEYSSCYHLTRGTGKKLWFLIDPMEDTPNRPMEAYRHGYERTLLAALMFPRVDSYEVLVWPNRILPKVPREYATVINTAVGVLCDLWRYPDSRREAGSKRIGTFVADSMGWQRGEPAPSDYDGFYGLAMPLVLHGVPVQVLSLDRAVEPRYLSSVRTLLVSYDFLKPAQSAINRALADWTRAGGTLVFFGGTDAYNAVTNSWWHLSGFGSPGEDLFKRMGLDLGRPRVVAHSETELLLESVTNALTGAQPGLRIPKSYPLTIYPVPAGATPLYGIAGETNPVVWQVVVGKGTLMFAGVAPGCLGATTEGSQWFRSLARHAYELAGDRYREHNGFLVRRGPYVGVYALENEFRVEGRFVNLLTPSLTVTENPTVPPHECAFLAKAEPGTDRPRLLAVSGRLRARNEQPWVTAFMAQAPAQTDGVARFWRGEREVKEAKAFTVNGATIPITCQVEADTVIVRYPNCPEGVVVRLNWKANR